MVQIRQAEREIQAQHIGQQYIDGGNVQGAFGEQIANSLTKVGKALDGVTDFVLTQKDRIDKTNALALKNAIYSEWEEPKLYSEDGYYNQLGRNASGKSAEVMSDYDKFVENKAKQLGLTGGLAKRYALEISSQERRRILRTVGAHDLKQTQEAEKAETVLRLETINQQGLHNRNDETLIAENVENLKKATVDYARQSNLDDTQTSLAIKNNLSNFYANIITSCCNENNLKGKVYLEKYKNDINPNTYIKLEQLVHKTDINVNSRAIANSYMLSGLDIQQAHEEAQKIKDLDLRDAVESRITHQYNQKDSDERKVYQDKLDKTWENVVQSKSIDDIPNDLKPSDVEKLKKYIQQGGGKEDDNTYVQLYEMSVQNAEEFATLDLNNYRDSLSDSQFVSFRKRQQDIQTHGYSVITTEDEEVLAVAKQLGLRKTGKKSIAEIAQNMINAEEKRRGKKLTTDEANKYFEYLGFKNENGSTLNLMEQYGGCADFYKNVARSKGQFSTKYGREPNNQEIKNIIWTEATRIKQKQISSDYEQIKNDIVAKAGETKLLTYYADKYIPQLSKDLGINLKVTSRYRPNSSNYKSHHSEGIACDISMSEHSQLNRYKILQTQLNNPNVKAIGCSDEFLLNQFRPFIRNGKLIDERSFDKTHGTNHVNHLHVTLNATNEKQNINTRSTNVQRVLISDANGNKFTVPVSQLDEAIKQGYKKL